MANSSDLLINLTRCIAELAIEKKDFGRANLIEKEVKNIEKLFQTSLTAKPSEKNTYLMALNLMKGYQLEDWELDEVAAAISLPIKEFNDLAILETPHILVSLLEKYEQDIKNGYFSRLTWYSLLSSYLMVDLQKINSSGHQAQFDLLRNFLEKTWHYIDNANVVPDWVRVLRSNKCLFSATPADQYAQAVLEGNMEQIKDFAKGLCIPPSSWFWQKLVLATTQRATHYNDKDFKQHIPLIIDLIGIATVYRDEAIISVLNRYFSCENKEVNSKLRDFVIDTNVWKNPKLKSVGIASAWNQVPENVWKMVLGWVNERNLKDFFQILAARSHSDQGRLEFWSRYLGQILWTKLVFGRETLHQKEKNESIQKLLEAEKGSYAIFGSSIDWELDAFLMQINDYIFVEFSKKNNGAYGYRVSDLKFDLHAELYKGNTDDLKYGHYEHRLGNQAIKIIHGLDWEDYTEDRLKYLGIFPDRKIKSNLIGKHEVIAGLSNSVNYFKTVLSTETSDATKNQEYDAIDGTDQQLDQSSVSVIASNKTCKFVSDQVYSVTPETKSLLVENNSLSVEKLTKFDKNFINSLLERYPDEVIVEDLRSKFGGRLWVYPDDYMLDRDMLDRELKYFGFIWSNKRNGWYLRED